MDSALFSWIGSAFTFFSMSLYFRQVVKGVSIPNPATWLIWLVIGIMNTVTYFLMVGNILRSLVLIVVTSWILVVTVYSIVYGKFAPLKQLEKLTLIIAFFVGILWKSTGNPVLANLTLQIVYVISFVPTLVGLYCYTLREEHWPWTLAIFAYFFMILAVVADWPHTNWVALVHPIVNGLIGNGLVVVLALRQRRHARVLG